MAGAVRGHTRNALANEILRNTNSFLMHKTTKQRLANAFIGEPNRGRSKFSVQIKASLLQEAAGHNKTAGPSKPDIAHGKQRLLVEASPVSAQMNGSN